MRRFRESWCAGLLGGMRLWSGQWWESSQMVGCREENLRIVGQGVKVMESYCLPSHLVWNLRPAQILTFSFKLSLWSPHKIPRSHLVQLTFLLHDFCFFESHTNPKTSSPLNHLLQSFLLNFLQLFFSLSLSQISLIKVNFRSAQVHVQLLTAPKANSINFFSPNIPSPGRTTKGKFLFVISLSPLDSRFALEKRFFLLLLRIAGGHKGKGRISFDSLKFEWNCAVRG